MSQGHVRGRRRALGVCAAGLGAAWALAVAGPADAESTVVSATVFTGASGAAAARPVSLSTLEACPAYTGPGALTLEPQGSTDTLAAGATWTLSEVLFCGLQIPISDVTDVQVLHPSGAPEAPLSAAQLSDPSGYADPAAPGALPVVSGDGGQAINSYTRPWRGGSDDNAADQVSESGPIAVDVYENAAPLVVHVHAAPRHRGPASERVALSATVTTAAGTALPASALQWRWTVSTGRSSRLAAPSTTIPKAATTTISVLVSDPATGTGGTASLALAYRPTRSRAATHNGGGGSGRRVTTAGLGSSTPHHHGRDARPRAGGHASGASPGAGTSGSTSSTPTTTSTGRAAGQGTATAPPTAPPTTASPAPRATTTTTPTTTTPAAPHSPTPAHRPAAHHRTAPPRRATRRRPIVRGRLIGELTAAPAPTSPPAAGAGSQAAGAVTSPDVADRFTVPGAVLAAAVVVALLGLGATRERWARSPRLHR